MGRSQKSEGYIVFQKCWVLAHDKKASHIYGYDWFHKKSVDTILMLNSPKPVKMYTD